MEVNYSIILFEMAVGFGCMFLAFLLISNRLLRLHCPSIFESLGIALLRHFEIDCLLSTEFVASYEEGIDKAVWQQGYPTLQSKLQRFIAGIDLPTCSCFQVVPGMRIYYFSADAAEKFHRIPTLASDSMYSQGYDHGIYM